MIQVYVTGLFPFALALLWWWQARDHPKQHPEVDPEELALIAAGRAAESATGQAPSWWFLWKNWNIAFLCMRYFLTSYVMFVFVFWRTVRWDEQREEIV